MLQTDNGLKRPLLSLPHEVLASSACNSLTCAFPGTSLGQGALLGLTRLVSLTLAELRIMDADCAGIAALRRLTQLDLRNSMVSDAGVQQLSRLTSLQCLDLTWTKASAPPALSSLIRLHMDNCQVLLLHSPQPLGRARAANWSSPLMNT